MFDLGFSDTGINWIVHCIATPTFKVIGNGRTSNMTYPEHDIRQGDLFLPIFSLFVWNNLTDIFTSWLTKRNQGLVSSQRLTLYSLFDVYR